MITMRDNRPKKAVPKPEPPPVEPSTSPYDTPSDFYPYYDPDTI
jgi:hypothetical protein